MIIKSLGGDVFILCLLKIVNLVKSRSNQLITKQLNQFSIINEFQIIIIFLAILKMILLFYIIIWNKILVSFSRYILLIMVSTTYRPVFVSFKISHTHTHIYDDRQTEQKPIFLPPSLSLSLSQDFIYSHFFSWLKSRSKKIVGVSVFLFLFCSE